MLIKKINENLQEKHSEEDINQDEVKEENTDEKQKEENKGQDEFFNNW